MEVNGPQPRLHLLHSLTLIAKYVKFIGPLCLLFGLTWFHGWWETVHASQHASSESAYTDDSGTGGITGYIVGSGSMAAYTCPDVNTAKCPIRLTLYPGTAVLIVDNVIGSNVPSLNDDAWRKIVYQGQTLFVPMRYVSVTPPGKDSEPDISLVETSFEDDSISAPNPASGVIVAPASSTIPNHLPPPAPPLCSPTTLHLSSFNGQLKCCPAGMAYNGSVCSAPGLPSWYIATDGRIDGNAGDRIAIYCRRTGRIEVWSINESQGHFLVEFNHIAVDDAAYHSFTVSVGAQGIVTIGGDGHGLYWAAIHGGPFNATGAGDFAKIFHCYVS